MKHKGFPGGARTWCTGKTQRDWVEREVGGGIGMGNTCKPMAVSFQCMTKFTTNKKRKNPPAHAGDLSKRHGFDPWVGKVPWRRSWPPTPVFLPGESHGQRGLAGYTA